MKEGSREERTEGRMEKGQEERRGVREGAK